MSDVDAVPAPDGANESAEWQQSLLSAGAALLSGSAIRAISKQLSLRPNLISFAGGMPAPAAFPVQSVLNACDAVLTRHARAALQYGPTDGYAELRAWIAERLSCDGAKIAAERVQIVSGSQQGLDLLGKILIDPGDCVAVETPSYVGALQALGFYRPHFHSLPGDADGIAPQAIATAGDLRAKLIYVIPTFQNPTGLTWSQERRLAAVERAASARTLIVEDDPYGALDYRGLRHRTLLSMNPEGVVYLGSFSKILAPGLRIGYVVAPPRLAAKLEQAKQAADLHTSSFVQMVVYEILKDGFLDRHLPQVRSFYAQQCAVMMSALDRDLPGTVRWTRPDGGMFTWMTLPERCDATSLLDAALASDVAFVPGAPFYATQSAANTLRLSFASVSAKQIDVGVNRLAAAIQQSLDRTRQSA